MSEGFDPTLTVESAARPAEETCLEAGAASAPAAAEIGGLPRPRGEERAEEEKKQASSTGEVERDRSCALQDSLREISYRSFLFATNKEIFENAARAPPEEEKARQDTLAAAAFELSRAELLRTPPHVLLPHCQLILLSCKRSRQACAALAALCVEERGRQASRQQQQHRVFFLVGVNSSSSRSSGDGEGVKSNGTRPQPLEETRSGVSGESLGLQRATADAAATAAVQNEAKKRKDDSEEPCSASTQADADVCWQLWDGQKEEDVCPVAAVVIFAAEPRLLRKKGNFYLNLVSLASRMIEAFERP